MTSSELHSSAAPPSTEEHYTALREDLGRAVRRVCPPWLRDREDDLVQCAVLRVMDIERKSEGIRDLGSSYLYRVAYSAMIDEIRRIRRRGETPLEAEGPEPVHEPEVDKNPEELAQAAEQGAAIRDCLGLLPTPRRSAVTLYLAGHSVPQSATILQWTFKKTENLVYRGLADLRQCLMRKGVRP
jgi:RNA polymerase sigma-70 factor (ECF subfamily)